MRNKVVAMAVTLVLLLGLLGSACAPAAAPTPTPTKPPASPAATPTPLAVATPTPVPPTPTKPAAPVTLRFLAVTGEPRNTTHKAFIKMFEEKHPNIKVEYETVPFMEFFRKIAVSLASGTPHDVIDADGPNIKGYAYAGSIIPLDDIYTKEDMADFVEASVREGSWQGKLYAGPYIQSSILIFYNTKMFDEAGIKPPKTLEEAWTWPQFAEALRKVVGPIPPDGVPKVWGLVTRSLGTDYDWIPMVRSNDKPGTPTFLGMSPDGTKVTGYIDTPQALEAFQFMSDFHNKWKLSPQATVPEAFETGKAATFMVPEVIRATFGKYPDLKWSITPLPYFKTPITHTGAFMYTVTAGSKHQKEAKEFIKFLTSKELAVQKYNMLKTPPARKSVYAQISEYQTFPINISYLELVKWGHARPETPGYTEYATLLKEALADIIKGMPVERTIKTAATKIDAELKKYAK
ncbi:MAG: sugar ABC transporter substrate-binding protein [Chloroflexi bacterium]|nr:sugar ABC transporter substrate-binding protein [Chloroflexota bacterium]MCL5075199.1 sugar ABC transporter substrate-binding protein [Chloroflexota bacterium]